jgi:putative transposase
VTDVITDEKPVVDLDSAVQPKTPAAQPRALSEATNDELVRQLAERARAEGLQLTGEGGLLAELTKRVVEAALDGELDDHLGYTKHDPAGRDGANSRNGRRGKRLLTDAGPLDIEVPRDRDGSFEPQLVHKRQRRLSGLDDLVISLSAKGLTHGEIAAHLAEVYGASVSKTTISTITDRVLDGMADWQSRPLDPVYPVVFIDAVNVKIREGNVANRPIYLALGSPSTAPATSSGYGPASTATGRGRAFGSGCSPRSRIVAPRTSAWWSATASRGCPRRSKPFGRKRLPKPA